MQSAALLLVCDSICYRQLFHQHLVSLALSQWQMAMSIALPSQDPGNAETRQMPLGKHAVSFISFDFSLFFVMLLRA